MQRSHQAQLHNAVCTAPCLRQRAALHRKRGALTRWPASSAADAAAAERASSAPRAGGSREHTRAVKHCS
jgi:hypothetical protein